MGDQELDPDYDADLDDLQFGHGGDAVGDPSSAIPRPCEMIPSIRPRR